jgi:hypothetical protein
MNDTTTILGDTSSVEGKDATSGIHVPDASIMADNINDTVDLQGTISSKQSDDTVCHNTDSRATTTTTTTTTAPSTATVTKCSHCQRRSGSRECTSLLCVTCCSDPFCEKHNKVRAAALFREQVMNNETEIQKMAARQRLRLLPSKRFYEPGLRYQGDTVIIWHLRRYMDNPKWREDAIRKSQRRHGLRVNDMLLQRTNTFRDCSYQKSITDERDGTDNVMIHQENSKMKRDRKRKQRFHLFIENRYKSNIIALQSS